MVDVSGWPPTLDWSVSNEESQVEHWINDRFLHDRIEVDLVGVGGNGAQMAHCLARLDSVMRALGHPHGLRVRPYDPDRVSPSNVGRQAYSPADVGSLKAVTTIERINRFYGLDWSADPQRYLDGRGDLVIGCVDSAAARRAIHGVIVSGHRHRYWLDLGNTEASGQVVLGECGSHAGQQFLRLPLVTELFPQLLDPAQQEPDEPSCSVAMSVASQGLFVNDLVVRFAAQLLYQLFCTGRLRHHGVVLNVASMRAGPIEVDPAVWARFGLTSSRP